MSIAATLLNPL